MSEKGVSSVQPRQRGVGGKVLVSPVEETTEAPEALKGQKPWVSEERGRVHSVEAARRGWAEKNDILNSRPLNGFLAALQ